MAVEVAAIAPRGLTAYSKWTSIYTLSICYSNRHPREDPINLLFCIQIYNYRAILLVNRYIPELSHLVYFNPISLTEN